mmetsp:Transcript_45600/g.55347  ORF Transcript_45600/g.55347 Transcript_45600/m.55347 type:complete len:362 (+) Transcript_45600:463-1548(+)
MVLTDGEGRLSVLDVLGLLVDYEQGGAMFDDIVLRSIGEEYKCVRGVQQLTSGVFSGVGKMRMRNAALNSTSLLNGDMTLVEHENEDDCDDDDEHEHEYDNEDDEQNDVTSFSDFNPCQSWHEDSSHNRQHVSPLRPFDLSTIDTEEYLVRKKRSVCSDLDSVSDDAGTVISWIEFQHSALTDATAASTTLPYYSDNGASRHDASCVAKYGTIVKSGPVRQKRRRRVTTGNPSGRRRHYAVWKTVYLHLTDAAVLYLKKGNNAAKKSKTLLRVNLAHCEFVNVSLLGQHQGDDEQGGFVIIISYSDLVKSGEERGLRLILRNESEAREWSEEIIGMWRRCRGRYLREVEGLDISWDMIPLC